MSEKIDGGNKVCAIAETMLHIRVGEKRNRTKAFEPTKNTSNKKANTANNNADDLDRIDDLWDC